MIGRLSVGIAAYELLAWAFGWTVVSQFHGRRRLARDAWYIALGVHFALESRKH